MKRRLFKLAVFLLLGAIVSVGLSWGSVFVPSKLLWTVYDNDLSTDEAETIWHRYARNDWPSAPRRNIWPKTVTSRSPVVIFERRGGYAGEYTRLAVLTITPDHSSAKYWCVEQLDVGWPFRQLRASVVQEPGVPNEAIHDGFVVQRAKKPKPVLMMGGSGPFVDPSTTLLPTGVLWSGLIANTGFFAFALVVIPVCSRFLVRAVRYDKGKCPICGYDLRDNGRRARYMLRRGCPGCGWRREKAS